MIITNFYFLFQQLDLVSPFQLYFNPNLILKKYQLWRLISTFLFFGNLGFNFFFNMIFTYRYCRMLEEGSFRGRTADFVVMFVFGGVLMIVSFLLQIIQCVNILCHLSQLHCCKAVFVVEIDQ